MLAIQFKEFGQFISTAIPTRLKDTSSSNVICERSPENKKHQYFA